MGTPVVLKTRRYGYDGKGQAWIRAESEVEAGWAAIGEEPPPKAWVRGRPLQLLLQRDFQGFEAALAEYRERGHIIRKRED